MGTGQSRPSTGTSCDISAHRSEQAYNLLGRVAQAWSTLLCSSLVYHKLNFTPSTPEEGLSEPGGARVALPRPVGWGRAGLFTS